MANKLYRNTTTPSNLAKALDIPVNRILALADAGWLCIVKGPGYKRVAKADPFKTKIRIVDRASILLWLTGNDQTIPVFNTYIEKEIMRIARLPEPMKTEQAIRLLLRYRDAETLAAAVLRAGSAGVESIQRLRESERLKSRARYLAGIANGRPRRGRAASGRFPSVSPTAPDRKLRQ